MSMMLYSNSPGGGEEKLQLRDTIVDIRMDDFISEDKHHAAQSHAVI